MTPDRTLPRTANLPLGMRITAWRMHRGMSRQVLADLVGKSKSWLDKIEGGSKPLDKLSVILDVARVLNIDVTLLLAPNTTAVSCVACGRPVAPGSRGVAAPTRHHRAPMAFLQQRRTA